MPRALGRICSFGLLIGALLPRAAAAEPDAPRRGALLVGCTRYPALAERFQLRGPANDVVLMRSLLKNRFGFRDQQITTLSEEQTAAQLKPTRANIEHSFRQLAAQARQGDQVVILMAGHGSQQPDGDPPDPNDPEPDGLDEIFLPADVGGWDGRAGKVANAIIDDELRDWLGAITAKGASVCIIMDACHSGTMTRGTGEETTREVPPEQLVPAEALEKAHHRALSAPEQTRGIPAAEPALDASGTMRGLVAIYAAQATEPTVEKPLPSETPRATTFGLLTYTLSMVLSQAAEPISYS